MWSVFCLAVLVATIVRFGVVGFLSCCSCRDYSEVRCGRFCLAVLVVTIVRFGVVGFLSCCSCRDYSDVRCGQFSVLLFLSRL